VITSIFNFLGVNLSTLDVVIVPLDQWHRVFERVRRAEARVHDLERQVAAMEQSHDC
jgi:hypothetical protein